MAIEESVLLMPRLGVVHPNGCSPAWLIDTICNIARHIPSMLIVFANNSAESTIFADNYIFVLFPVFYLISIHNHLPRAYWTSQTIFQNLDHPTFKMQRSIFFSFLALLISYTGLVSAVASRSVDITDLSIFVGGNSTNTISFSLFDNESDANPPAQVGHCSATFTTNQPQGLSIPCVGDDYTASISSYTSYNDFSLHISYSYHDQTVGQPDFVTVFANAAINSTELTCSPATRRHARDLRARQSNSSHTCTQPSGTSISAPITSLIAKK
ncbi:hypothetical protein MRB53_041236 [Persea americana]|nr:hypothetical protein MRB53_041236 [Persea americana]